MATGAASSSCGWAPDNRSAAKDQHGEGRTTAAHDDEGAAHHSPSRATAEEVITSFTFWYVVSNMKIIEMAIIIMLTEQHT